MVDETLGWCFYFYMNPGCFVFFHTYIGYSTLSDGRTVLSEYSTTSSPSSSRRHPLPYVCLLFLFCLLIFTYGTVWQNFTHICLCMLQNNEILFPNSSWFGFVYGLCIRETIHTAKVNEGV